jgi:anti-sigma regulatory factor (Ser/Thr protein kinase)
VTSTAVSVSESSQVAEARRVAVDCATGLGFAASDAGRVGIAATELATNLIKHGRGGELVVTASNRDAAGAVDLIAVDTGPGMADWRHCLKDGYSTTGSPGTGLGAIMRASADFDVYSTTGKGTTVFSRLTRHGFRPNGTARQLGGISVPFPGERECGDGWAMTAGEPGRLRLLIVDGLGHGALAADASRAALDLFASSPRGRTSDALTRIHLGLKATRGAAGALVEIDEHRGLVSYCGVGNISGVILTGAGARHMVSHNGTLGFDARRIQEFTYPWSSESVLLVHSDGIGTHWRLEDYPGLVMRHPALLAGTLYRDFRRKRDDCTVVAVGAGRPNAASPTP